ncbi:MAG: cyclophilin-like fold protein [Lachnospiraceae bacterium]|nr:cyclophilin-like fold protein [Lachnospiraceae bacterium]
MKNRFYQIAVVLVLAILFLCACGASKENAGALETETDSGSVENISSQEAGTYQQISQDEARKIMDTEKGILILDVRTQAEYDSSFIPGAVCLPNETIQAAWNEQQENGNQDPAQGSALDEVSSILPDKQQKILVYCRSGRRSKEASQALADMGYTNVFEFGGINDWTGEIITPEVTSNIHLGINGENLPVIWENNASVDELKQLAKGGITIQLSKYGGFEQVGELGAELSRNDVQMTTEPGDIVLYSGNQIVVFYGSNSWAYTKLGRLNLSQEELERLLGGEDVELSLFY